MREGNTSIGSSHWIWALLVSAMFFSGWKERQVKSGQDLHAYSFSFYCLKHLGAVLLPEYLFTPTMKEFWLKLVTTRGKEDASVCGFGSTLITNRPWGHQADHSLRGDNLFFFQSCQFHWAIASFWSTFVKCWRYRRYADWQVFRDWLKI